MIENTHKTISYTNKTRSHTGVYCQQLEIVSLINGSVDCFELNSDFDCIDLKKK